MRLRLGLAARVKTHTVVWTGTGNAVGTWGLLFPFSSMLAINVSEDVVPSYTAPLGQSVRTEPRIAAWLVPLAYGGLRRPWNRCVHLLRPWPRCALSGHDDRLQRSGARRSDGVSRCQTAWNLGRDSVPFQRREDRR